MVDALTVPLAGSAALLALAATGKIARPVPTDRALRALDWPSGVAVVRLLGLVELVVAVGTWTGPVRAFGPLLAALHAGFAAFVMLALARRTPLASCGCFGRDDTPPTPLHVAWNAAVAAVGVLAAAQDVRSPLRSCRDGIGSAAVVVFGALVVAAVGYGVLSSVVVRRRPTVRVGGGASPFRR